MLPEEPGPPGYAMHLSLNTKQGQPFHVFSSNYHVVDFSEPARLGAKYCICTTTKHGSIPRSGISQL